MKVHVLSWLILVIFSCILIGQLFRLEIIKGKEQARRSSQNRFRIKTIEAPRGVFFDNVGNPLVENTPVGRHYLLGEPFAHILGYIGEANENELTLFSVESGQKIGKTGLEREHNGLLKGTEGGEVIEVGASGEQLRTFSHTNPIPGRNIQLTISKQLQELSFSLLAASKSKGAIIVGTPTGQLVALAAYPSFDPNVFSGEQTEATENYIRSLFTNDDKPMFNRAIAGLYPPASTFKIITAISSLESGAISAQTQVEDTGEITAGGISFGNWYYREHGGKDGLVTVTKALQRSNDIFFYKAGEQVGIERLAQWAKTFGLGKLTNIPLSGEAQGLVPDPQWKKEALHEAWYTGDTYNTSIGQGNLLVTPIQVHMEMTLVANNGYLCQPTLVGAVVDQPTQVHFSADAAKAAKCQKVTVKNDSLQTVKSGLKQACDTGGTGWPLFGFKVTNPHLPIDNLNFFEAASSSAAMVRIPVACKTGTAETGSSQNHGNPNQKTHAWFTVFAPAEQPELIVTVLLEEAGQGSDKAAPLAREVLKKWFEMKN